MRIFLIMRDDIVKYPPVISIIYSLLFLDVKPCLIGNISSPELKNDFKSKGVEYYNAIEYNVKDSNIKKLYNQLSFKKNITSILREKFEGGDLVWIFNLETIILLEKIVEKYPSIIHFFEFSPPHFNWKYKILNPFFSLKSVLHNAYNVVHCEYNRSQITKGLYDMDYLPVILPNKPFYDENLVKHPPLEIKKKIEQYRALFNERKVILYQGGFNEHERPLDAFCQAIENLPEDFLLVMMGSDSPYKKKLISKYRSERILFPDYIPAPFHLLLTQMSYIAILTYYPCSSTFADVINPIYCAPNKLFEYTKFGKPMIGNNIPGLYYDFRYYHSGLCVDDPLEPSAIVRAIEKIDEDYSSYAKGALELYNSVDINKKVSKIIGK